MVNAVYGSIGLLQESLEHKDSVWGKMQFLNVNNGLITRSGESYLETSEMRRRWPALGCCAEEEEEEKVGTYRYHWTLKSY